MTVQTLDVEQIRKEFPVTKEWIYFDHASNGPFPLRTAEAMAKAGLDWTVPTDFDYPAIDAKRSQVKEWLAILAGATPDRVAFTSSLAESMNIMAHSIDWRAGDNVLLETGEFPSVVYTFRNLERRNNIEICWVDRDRDGHARIEDFEAAINDRTRAIAISHVEFMDGYRNDLFALGELCQRRNIDLFVDATQSYGALPIEIDATGVTAVGAHAFKWLLCNYETGVLVLGQDALNRMNPVFAGRESVTSDTEDQSYPLVWKPTAERFQLSNLSTQRVEIMHASLSVIMEVGLEQSHQHTAALTDYLAKELSQLGYHIISDRSPEHKSQIIVFSSPDSKENESIVNMLRSQHVAVSYRGGNIRVSPYFYNTFDELETLLEFLPLAQR